MGQDLTYLDEAREVLSPGLYLINDEPGFSADISIDVDHQCLVVTGRRDGYSPVSVAILGKDIKNNKYKALFAPYLRFIRSMLQD